MPLRQQGDGLGDAASKASKIDCSGPSRVRPEFGPDCDVKTILRRHNGIPPVARTPEFTETNYDTDLTKALTQLERAHAAFQALPKEHRQRYRTPDELWRRYRTDNLRQDYETEQTPATPAPTTQTATGVTT